jgi:hypothetical protein
MKYYLSFLIILNLFQFEAQTSQDSLKIAFDIITELDNKAIKSKLLSKEVKNQIFLNNLKISQIYILKNKLREDSLLTYNKKTYLSICGGYGITFIHLVKYYPSAIFNEEYISFMENQIKNYNFDINLIVPNLGTYYSWMTYYDPSRIHKNENPIAKKINHQYDEIFYDMVKRFGISIDTLKLYIRD